MHQDAGNVCGPGPRPHRRDLSRHQLAVRRPDKTRLAMGPGWGHAIIFSSLGGRDEAPGIPEGRALPEASILYGGEAMTDPLDFCRDWVGLDQLSQVERSILSGLVAFVWIKDPLALGYWARLCLLKEDPSQWIPLVHAWLDEAWKEGR